MHKFAPLAFYLLSASSLAASIENVNSIPDNGKDSTKGFHGQVGIAIANLPKFSGSDDKESVLLPLINANYNDRFYFKFNRLGAWFYKNDNGFRFGGVITSHAGYDKEDIKQGDIGLLWGDRDTSLMAGLNFSYKYQRFSAETGYVSDISDNSEGAKTYLTASYRFFLDKQISLSVNANVELLDADIVKYYYGKDKSTVNATLGVVATYRLSKNWHAMAALTTTALGDEISESVVSSKDNYNVAIAGVTYSF
jgi:outer membrane scaffolding protein for murein synthesis (MipA/OmpV family)